MDMATQHAKVQAASTLHDHFHAVWTWTWSWQPCPGRAVLEVLPWQSCSACLFSACPVPAVLPFCPLVDVLPSAVLPSAVLPWLSFTGNPPTACPCPGGPELLVHPCLSGFACPIFPLLFCLSCSFYLSCFVGPVLPFLLCQSCSACPVLPVLFWLSCSGCPVLAVLFCLSYPFGPALAVLF
jgi:hypothetical protein